MASARVEARRAVTRARIIETAWEIARSEGWEAVGVREIAARLDMAPSSLYGYFTGKDAIYDAMFVEGNMDLRTRYADLATSADRRNVLVAMARQFVEFCDEDHARFQLLFQHAIPGWNPSPTAYASAVDNYEQMRSLMAELGINTDRSLDLWTALTSGLASQQVANDPGGDRWLQLVETAVDLFLGREST